MEKTDSRTRRSGIFEEVQDDKDNRNVWIEIYVVKFMGLGKPKCHWLLNEISRLQSLL